MKTPSNISLPPGVRDILPDEAERVARVTEAAGAAFRSAGFRRVVTPLLEYMDVLATGLGKELQDRTLKFIEPSSGSVMAVRPDITPQVARLVASHLRDAPLPLKLYYIENVLRCLDGGGGGGEGNAGCRELLQAGVELITEESSPEADAEMVTLAIETLKKAGVEDFKVDLGDVGFVRTVIDGLKVPNALREKITKAVGVKDTPALEALLKDTRGVSAKDKDLLLALTTLYGGDEVIEEALGFGVATGELQRLKKTVDEIRNLGYGEYITVDLGEVRGFDYYTGVIFEGFAPGFGKPLLGGGRYDTLLEKYGLKARSTGFAIDIENVVTILEK